MGEVKFLEGNHAAAYGVKLSRPDVIAAFPITPQTPLVEHLADMHVAGDLGNCVYQRTESEHSSMSHSVGASAAGARAFTAIVYGLSSSANPLVKRLMAALLTS